MPHEVLSYMLNCKFLLCFYLHILCVTDDPIAKRPTTLSPVSPPQNKDMASENDYFQSGVKVLEQLLVIEPRG